MDTRDLIYQKTVEPIALGVNAGALSGTVNGTAINVAGFNQLTVECFCDWTAATAVQMAIHTRKNSSDTWHPIQDLTAAGAGVYTSVPLSLSQAVSADESWTWNVPINYTELRLVFTSTAGTSDTITARVILGVV